MSLQVRHSSTSTEGGAEGGFVKGVYKSLDWNFCKRKGPTEVVRCLLEGNLCARNGPGQL